VLSTIHTNDAATGITRLVDMGVQPFLPSPRSRSLVAPLQAQRLAAGTVLERPAATSATAAGPACTSC
jgi:general secretion pathway protein E